MMTHLHIDIETYLIAGHFTIARGSRTHAHVVVVTLEKNGFKGRGECVPYARYGETIESVSTLIESLRLDLSAGLTRQDLQTRLPTGAARNALDCAFWDLEAKTTGQPVAERIGLPLLQPVTTAFTLSLDTPEAMGIAAQKSAHRPLLKIKLGGLNEDQERLMSVRENAPDSTLIIDANEGWNEKTLPFYMALCEKAKVALIEQPLPAGQDELLASIKHTIPLCADESAHDRSHLDEIAERYDVINIKLDKTGGLTEALLLAYAAHEKGLAIMIGCMVGTSLSMAPALCLASKARFVDLDGPLLLAQDRSHGLLYEGSVVSPPSPLLWG
jgi:L-Ala-D/L-Glu epimerase